MNERKLRRLFPRAAESFIRLNSDSSEDSTSSKKPKLLDEKQIQDLSRKEKVAPTYRLRACSITYRCAHGQELDPSDNAIFAAIKPCADALVAIGLARNDKEFKTDARQRMD